MSIRRIAFAALALALFAGAARADHVISLTGGSVTITGSGNPPDTVTLSDGSATVAGFPANNIQIGTVTYSAGTASGDGDFSAFIDGLTLSIDGETQTFSLSVADNVSQGYHDIGLGAADVLFPKTGVSATLVGLGFELHDGDNRSAPLTLDLTPYSPPPPPPSVPEPASALLAGTAVLAGLGAWARRRRAARA